MYYDEAAVLVKGIMANYKPNKIRTALALAYALLENASGNTRKLRKISSDTFECRVCSKRYTDRSYKFCPNCGVMISYPIEREPEEQAETDSVYILF